MRLRHLVLVCALAGSACGGDDSTGPTVQNGTLRFVLDQVTCTGSGSIELFIDGTSQGIYSFTPGAERSYTVQAGSHTAGAREIGGTAYVWPTQTIAVPVNSTYSLSLTC
jgi:hypothetical protein